MSKKYGVILKQLLEGGMINSAFQNCVLQRGRVLEREYCSDKIRRKDIFTMWSASLSHVKLKINKKTAIESHKVKVQTCTDYN